ncbi:MAG: NosD domain-containing protein [Promethearchaeota archaeon]
MKSNRKTTILILIILVIIFAFSPLLINNLKFTSRDRDIASNHKDEFDYGNLKISGISETIYIDGNSGWIAFEAAGNCTGNGTISEPYVIEDLEIDGGGGSSGNCILIQNSDVYFKIENCSTYYSGGSSGNAGIKLYNVSNAQLIDNYCYSNAEGIYLVDCYNNTISGNTVSDNSNGIYLYNSTNNIVTENTANDNILNYAGINVIFSNDNIILGNILNRDGIHISRSINNTLSGNIMNECGLRLYGFDIEEIDSHNIDITNLVNGKPLYYYTNEANLKSNDFLNAGQVILINCSDSIISNLNISYTSRGISLHFCHNNEITNNTVNNNLLNGIRLYLSDNNKVSGNTANNCTGEDGYGIELSSSDYNIVSDNTANNNLEIFGTGIRLRGGSDNNLVSGNTANNNYYPGIYIVDSIENNIKGNDLNYNGYGIMVYRSDSNNIEGNIAKNNQYGIYTLLSSYNTILGNTMDNNYCGIRIRTESNGNTILRNIINNNDYGIYITYLSNNNTISENFINYNTVVGLHIDVNCAYNNIYLNCFNNNLNARDDGLENRWDNGVKGNYWADYPGLDKNGNGIGDTPYSITGSAGSKDNFPLIKCPLPLRGIGGIPIELIILISIISGGAVIGVVTILLIRRRRKIIE